MRIWSRRLMRANPSGLPRSGDSAQAADGLADRAAGVGGLEHGGVAGLGEDAADEPVRAGERQLDHDRAVRELLGDGQVLARPAGPLGREPDAGDARRGHLAGARPALDVAERVDLGARLERLVEDASASLMRSRRKWRSSSLSTSTAATYQPSRPLNSA